MKRVIIDICMKSSDSVDGGINTLFKGVDQRLWYWGWRVSRADLEERSGRIFPAEGESAKSLR